MSPWEEHLIKLRRKFGASGEMEAPPVLAEESPEQPEQPDQLTAAIQGLLATRGQAPAQEQPAAPDVSSQLSRLGAQRDAAEGFGNINFAPSSIYLLGKGAYTVPEQKPYVAEQPRMEMGRILSEEKDLRKAQLQAAIDAMQVGQGQAFRAGESEKGRAFRAEQGGLNRAQRAAHFQEQQPFREALIESTLTNREQQLSLAKERHALTDEQRHRLSDKELEALTKHEDTEALLQDISADKSRFDTGPIAGRQHTLAGWIGLADPDKAAFKAKVQTQLTQAINSLAGLTMSRHEIAMIAPTVPQMNDQDNVFAAKAEVLLQRLQEHKARFLDIRRQAGKNVTEYQTPEPGTMPPMPGDAGKISVIGPNGEEGTMPADQWSEEWERKGWKRQ